MAIRNEYSRCCEPVSSAFVTLCDTLPGGEVVRFFRAASYLPSEDGMAVGQVADFAGDMVTPYVVQGEVGVCAAGCVCTWEAVEW